LAIRSHGESGTARTTPSTGILGIGCSAHPMPPTP
jgi:hypothetical protein